MVICASGTNLKLAVTIENHPCLEVLNNLKFTLCHTWVLVDVGKDHHPIMKDAFVQVVLK